MKAVADAEKALTIAQKKENKEKSSMTADAAAEFTPPPSKSDLLPQARLSTRYKEVDELNDDIVYFLKNFQSALKNEKTMYEKVNKKDKKVLTRLHNRITGKVASESSTSSSSSGQKILIGVDADKYIEQRMKDFINEKQFEGIDMKDATIPVEDNQEKDVKNVGSFEIKKNPTGGLSSRPEGSYRNAPTIQPEEERPKRRGRSGLKLLNRVERSRAKTAGRIVKNDVFLKKQRGGVELIYLH